MGDEQLWEGTEQCSVMTRTALERDLCASVWRVEQSTTRSRGTNDLTVSWGSGFALESPGQSVFKRGLVLRRLEAL